MGAILGIHHLCVQTPDMEASLHFYRDVLGFEVTDRETCDFGEYAMLQLHGTRLELIEPNQTDENSFGAKIRSNWYAKLILNGKQWQLLDLQIYDK